MSAVQPQRWPQVFCSDGRSNRRGGACRRCSTDTASGPVCLGGGLGDGFGRSAVPDAGFGRRGVAHEEAAILDLGRDDDLEIILDAEIPDLDFAQADDGQRRRLHPADADDALDARGEQRPSRGAGQRQVEDLVGLLARDGGLVEGRSSRLGLSLSKACRSDLGSWAVNRARRTVPR